MQHALNTGTRTSIPTPTCSLHTCTLIHTGVRAHLSVHMHAHRHEYTHSTPAPNSTDMRTSCVCTQYTCTQVRTLARVQVHTQMHTGVIPLPQPHTSAHLTGAWWVTVTLVGWCPQGHCTACGPDPREAQGGLACCWWAWMCGRHGHMRTTRVSHSAA